MHLHKLALVGAAIAIAAAHADAVDEGRALAAKATQAAAEKKFDEAADLTRAALEQRPSHPGLLLQLARANARAGRTGDALTALEDYAAMGLVTDVAAGDFAQIQNEPRLAAIRARIAENAKPRGRIAVAATIAEPALIEGIAYDPAGRRLFASSVSKRKIFAASANGATSSFVHERSNGLLGAFGLAVDAKRKTLWAASSAVPQAEGMTQTEKGQAGVFAFDLSTGEPKQAAMLPSDGKEHVLGDLIVTAGGDVFSTDSATPAIYRFRSGQTGIEQFLTSDEFHSPQGLSLSKDGGKLAIADYANGIHIVDLATKQRKLLPTPPHATLLGLDGLVRYGRDLVGVQNGVDPQRVVRIRLNSDWTAIEGVDVLAANLPEMSEPSLAARRGNNLMVVGNAQWSHFSDEGEIKEPLAATKIVSLSLPPPRE